MSRTTLRSIKIIDLNGFRDSDNRFLEKLTGCLDVVYAPNRSGKSSLATAYRLLLGEKIPQYDKNCAVTGELGPSTESSVSIIDRRNATVTGRFSGLQTEAPTYTRGSRAQGYVLHLPEMLTGLSGDERDVTSAALHGGIMTAPLRPANLSTPSNLRALLGALNNERIAAGSYETWNADLKDLECRLQQANSATRTSALLRYRLYEHHHSRLLAEYPGIHCQRQGSADQAQTLNRMLDAALDAHRRCSADLRTVVEDGARAAKDELNAADAATLERCCTEIARANGSRDAFGSACAAEKARRDEQAAELGGAIDLHTSGPVSADILQALPELADRSREETATLSAYVSAQSAAVEKRRGAEAQNSQDDRALVRRSADALREAARAAPPYQNSIATRVIVALVIAAVLALAGFVPGMGVVGPILSLAGLIGVVIALFMRTSPSKGSDDSNSAAEGADLPIDRLITDLQSAAERAAEIEQRTRAWEEVCARLDGLAASVGTRHALQYEAKLKSVQAAAGVANLNPYRLADLLNSVESWRESHLKVIELEAKIQVEKVRIEDLRGEIRMVMERCRFLPRSQDAPEDSTNALRRWFELSADFRNSLSAVNSAESKLRNYLVGIGVLKESVTLNALDEAIAIAVERETGSGAAPSALTRFHALTAEMAALGRDHFGGAPPGAAEIDEALRDAGAVGDDPERLTAAIEKQDEAARCVAGLMAQKGALEERIRKFESSDSAIAAVRALKEYQPEVENRMRERSQQFADYLVRTVVSEKSQAEASPEILTLTNAKLKSIDNDLEIRVLPGGSKNSIGPLVVNDGRNGRLNQLFEELSTSTKINVVLALKLAILEQSETDGNSLPIVVDEVMAVADETIRAGIARLLANEALHRQVIVMTNREDDLEALRTQSHLLNAAMAEHSIGNSRSN